MELGSPFLEMFVVLFGCGAAIVGWAIELNNRVKIKRMLEKKNYGIAGIIGKGAFLYRKVVDLTREELLLTNNKLFRLKNKDELGNLLFFYMSGVPWLIYNENKVNPLLPASDSEEVWWCETCEDEVKDPILSKGKNYCENCKKFVKDLNKDGECPYCEGALTEKETSARCSKCSAPLVKKNVILPVNPNKVGMETGGSPESLDNMFTLMIKKARIAAEDMLMKKLREMEWMKWGLVALGIGLLIVIGLVVVVMQGQGEMKGAILAAMNQTISAAK